MEDLEFNLNKALAHHSKRQVGVEELKRVIDFLRRKKLKGRNVTPQPKRESVKTEQLAAIRSKSKERTPVPTSSSPVDRISPTSLTPKRIISSRKAITPFSVSTEVPSQQGTYHTRNLPLSMGLQLARTHLAASPDPISLSPKNGMSRRPRRASPKSKARTTLRQILPNLNLNRSKDIQSAYLPSIPARRSPLKSMKSMRRDL